MAAYIYKDSLSKPRFRADLPRPIDALRLYPQSKWDSLSIIGQAGVESLKQGFDAQEFEIFHNRSEMLKEQDFVVFEREQGFVLPAWALWAAVGISVATSVYSIIQANKMKTPGNLNRTQESATNRIQSRENEPRVNQRVENNYGQLRNFFTQMSLPYIRCEDNQQAEYSYMSAGKGRYLIEDVRDARTLGSSLQQWTMQAYRPFESPNNAQPYMTIGTPFTQEVFTTFQSDDLDRQELDPPNALEVTTNWKMSYVAGKAQLTSTNTELDLRGYFSVGQQVSMEDVVAVKSIGVVEVAKYISETGLYVPKTIDTYSVELFGDGYEVESVTETLLTLNIPAGKDSIWTGLTNYEPWKITTQISHGENINKADLEDNLYNRYYIDSVTPGDVLSPVDTIRDTKIIGAFDGTIGPFEVEESCTSIQYNLYSDALLKDKGKNETYSITIDGNAIIRELDNDGNRTGNKKTYDWSLSSNEKNRRKQACRSFDIIKPYTRCSIEFVRTTDRDFSYAGSVRDIVELTELYFHRDDGKAHFGDKTTIQLRRTQTTYGIGKASKISALTTSELNINGTWTATRYFDDIVCDAAQDSVFGRRNPETVAQMRSDLRTARDELIDYFGREDVAYFDYCIDSENITFESFVKMVANAVFCTPYLKSTMRFAPDVAQPIDTAIFGHSNKLIADESLKFSFDDLSNKKYDCVEVKYRNPDNMDAQENFFIPSQGSNPKTVEANGVRNKRNAEIHGWREWNRILYQRYSYECTVGLEATQLIPNQRIGITNNCCAETLDGHFKAWDGGVNVRFSQEADLSEGGYKIVIQSPQGGVGVFGVTQGVDLWHGVLSEAPLFDINTNLKENLTVYRIAKEDDLTTESYALQEPELTDKGIKLKAVNYAPEVYSKDHI